MNADAHDATNKQRGHREPSVFDLVIFGGTGDLAMRRILPALCRRFGAGLIGPGSRIVGGRATRPSREAYLSQAEAACRLHLGADFPADGWGDLAAALSYARVDAMVARDYPERAAALRAEA